MPIATIELVTLFNVHTIVDELTHAGSVIRSKIVATITSTHWWRLNTVLITYIRACSVIYGAY